MQKITPFLWFNKEAEEAAKFYASVFKGKIVSTSYYPENSPGPAGSVMTVAFNILDIDFVALNGGQEEGFSFSPAISFVINCESQEEVDRYWNELSSDGGKTSQCGWLTDKYGIAWQVVPVRLEELLLDPDKEKANRVMQAMLKMTKIVIKDLEDAAMKS